MSPHECHGCPRSEHGAPPPPTLRFASRAEEDRGNQIPYTDNISLPIPFLLRERSETGEVPSAAGRRGPRWLLQVTPA
jgi:hypothetical protein